jgi:hypothetical protein
MESGIFGIVRPILPLPEGIAERLALEQLRHVQWRVNLTGFIHMLVEALFWFYPLGVVDRDAIGR